MSWVNKISLGVFLLLAVILVLVTLLVGTTTGLHLVLKLVSSSVPGLQISSVNGGWHNLILKQLHYQTPGITVNADELCLSVDLSYLRHLELCINNIILKDIYIRVKTAELMQSLPVKSYSKHKDYTISISYPLILQNLLLKNVQVTIDNTSITINNGYTGIDFRKNNLVVKPTHIIGLLVVLPKVSAATDKALAIISQAVKPNTCNQKQQVTTQASPPLAKIIRNLFSQQLLPVLPEFMPLLNIKVTEILVEDLLFTGNSNLLITKIILQAATQSQYIKLSMLDIYSPKWLLNISGKAIFTGQWPVDLIVNSSLNINPLQEEIIKCNISGSLRDELRIQINLSGLLTAQLALKTRLAQVGPCFTLTLNSPEIQWPLRGTIVYRAQEVMLLVEGEARNYRMTMKTSLSGIGLPPVDISMNGHGDTHGFTLSHLRIAALEGNTDLTVVVDWQHRINWRSELTINSMNTARQWPDWPAQLAGKVIILGSLYSGGWSFQVPILDLHGNIKQNTLKAKGTISGNAAGQWQIPELYLALGNNILNIKGILSDYLNLDVLLNTPELNGILPGISGIINGKIKLRGNSKAPQLLADINAISLRWADWTVRHVTLKSNISSNDNIHGNVYLHVDQLRQGNIFLKKLMLVATLNEKQHSLKLVMQSEPVAGQIHFNGSFDRVQRRWYGTLSRVILATPIGEWRLMHDIRLSYQNPYQKIIFGPHCWQNQNIQLCIMHSIEVSTLGKVGILSNYFNLIKLKSWLPTEIQANVIATNSWLPQGKLFLVGNGIRVIQILKKNNILPVVFDTLTVDARLDQDIAKLDWLIKIAGNGQFKGKIEVTNLKNQQNLSGHIIINHFSLSLLKTLLTQDRNIDGIVNANLQLGGNTHQPQLYGELRLDKFILKNNFMPFTMNNSQITINYTGTNAALQGSINTTSGNLSLHGKADWSSMVAWYARLQIKGERVRITVPLVRLDISPDIVFEATPALFTLTGKVDTPWARIEIKDLPQNMVGVSPDEVLLDKQLKPVVISNKTVTTSILTNLLINIGDNVMIDAFGLKAELKGILKIMQDKNRLVLNGQINIPSGRFHAYGQDLTVRTGQLLFSGLIDQPYLNIEAIRNPESIKDDVTTGIRVTGLVNHPKLEIFSEPIKFQQAPPSYLPHGQGLYTSSTESNIITSMLIGMGIAQSGQIVGKIGEVFGVSDLSLDTQGVGNSSQVVISGHIAPGLQLRYGIGIFDPITTLTLRYRLMPKLYLEAASGINQTLDLLYQFEF